MEYYWILKTRDGKELQIPPDKVEIIRRRMTDNQPINMKSHSIPANQIISFDMSDKIYTSQPLLDDVAQAFKQPMYTDDGGIKCRWVKKQVTHDKWGKYYSQQQYRKLADDGNMVTVAFRVAVHDIDQQLTPYCTEQEIQQLLSKG